MKKKNLNAKLNLKKESIVNLNQGSLKNIKGGGDGDCGSLNSCTHSEVSEDCTVTCDTNCQQGSCPGVNFCHI